MWRVVQSAARAATVAAAAAVLGAGVEGLAAQEVVPATPVAARQDEVALPRPQLKGTMSLEEVVAARRSVRRWAPGALTRAELSQVLWAAQGITSPDGKRSAPSAGGTHPIEVLVGAAAIEGLAPGMYRFVPKDQSLLRLTSGDPRPCLVRASGGQQMLGRAPLVLVIGAVAARTAGRYRERAPRFVAIEAGAAAENVYLQATALKLGTVIVGTAEESVIRGCAGLLEGEAPVLMMPVGRLPQ